MLLLATVALWLLFMNVVLAWMCLGMAIGALAGGGSIETVNLGIGPVMFRFRHRGTTYKIRLLPFGFTLEVNGLRGFRHRVFAVSGGLWSLLTAFALCYAQLGALGDATLFRAPRIGYVLPESDAARAGLMPGDTLLAIDGRPVRWWREAIVNMKSRPEPGTVQIRFARADRVEERVLSFERVDNRVLGEFSVFGLYPPVDPVVRNIARDGPAWQSGIRPGDRFLTIAETNVQHLVGVYVQLTRAADPALDVEIERQGARQRIRLERTYRGEILRHAGMDLVIVERGGRVELPFREKLVGMGRLFGDKVSLTLSAIRNRRLKGDLASAALPTALLGTVTDRIELLALLFLFWGTLNLSPFPPFASAQAWWGHTDRWGPPPARVLSGVFLALLVFVRF